MNGSTARFFAAAATAALLLAAAAPAAGRAAEAGDSWTPAHLYVSEPDAHLILRFRLRGGIPDRRPDGVIAGLQRPTGITVDADGRLYAVDSVAKQLFIFEAGAGSGAKPSHVLALEHTRGLGTVSVDARGLVYVGYQYDCSYLGPCSNADVYRPLPSGAVKPVESYPVSSSPPNDILSAMAFVAGRVVTVADLGLVVHYAPPKLPSGPGYPIFCGATVPWGAVWGPGNELDVSNRGHLDPFVGIDSIFVYPDYLRGDFPNCPNAYQITSATVPLDNPRGLARNGPLLYVTSDFNPSLGSGIVFVFDPAHRGKQTPLAVLAGPQTLLRTPRSLAVGP